MDTLIHCGTSEIAKRRALQVGQLVSYNLCKGFCPSLTMQRQDVRDIVQV